MVIAAIAPAQVSYYCRKVTGELLQEAAEDGYTRIIAAGTRLEATNCYQGLCGMLKRILRETKTVKIFEVVKGKHARFR